MPSSPNAAILSGAALADPDGARVSAWQPASFADGAAPQAAFALPHFEKDAKTAAPSLRAFAISRTAGIPEDLLAAESAAARAAGYADGYAVGIDEARTATRDLLAAEAAAVEAADAQRVAGIRQAFEALFDAAAELEGLAVQSAADIEEQIVSAAWAIATAIIGQALTDDDLRSQAAINRALALAPADEAVTVAVSLADFVVLAAAESQDSYGQDLEAWDSDTQASLENLRSTTDMTPIRRTRGLRTITIVPDDTLAEGDAFATCGATVIDARLSSAIDRVKQVLAQ